jgi:uncharacterized membrane protein
MSRAIIGALIGVVLAVVWHWLGWPAMVWAVILGFAGYGVGWTIEHPEWLIRLLHRLER